MIEHLSNMQIPHRHKYQWTPILMRFFLLLCLGLGSCEKVIDIDIDNQQLVVVNGAPSVGRELFVNISRAQYFLDTNSQHPVADVDLTLTVNGVDMSPCRVEGCNYFFDHIVQANDQISLSLNTPVTGKVTSSTVVPPKPPISDFEALLDTTGTFNLGLVTFRMDDFAGLREYYHITIAEHDSGVRYSPYREEYDTIDTVYNTQFFCATKPLNDAAVDQSMMNFFTNLLTTDSLIDGQGCEVSLILFMLVDTNEVEGFTHRYTLTVGSVSKERFRYLQDVVQTSSVASILSEAIPMYSNIVGSKATGVFGGVAQQKFDLNLPELPHPHHTPTRKCAQN